MIFTMNLAAGIPRGFFPSVIVQMIPVPVSLLGLLPVATSDPSVDILELFIGRSETLFQISQDHTNNSLYY